MYEAEFNPAFLLRRRIVCCADDVLVGMVRKYTVTGTL